MACTISIKRSLRCPHSHLPTDLLSSPHGGSRRWMPCVMLLLGSSLLTPGSEFRRTLGRTATRGLLNNTFRHSEQPACQISRYGSPISNLQR